MGGGALGQDDAGTVGEPSYDPVEGLGGQGAAVGAYDQRIGPSGLDSARGSLASWTRTASHASMASMVKRQRGTSRALLPWKPRLARWPLGPAVELADEHPASLLGPGPVVARNRSSASSRAGEGVATLNCDLA